MAEDRLAEGPWNEAERDPSYPGHGEVALPEWVLLHHPQVHFKGGEAAHCAQRCCSASFPGAEMLGFENHLNVFHEGKRGLPEEVARGLAVYLGSTAVDEHFRGFSGHTQVNATDLKLMRYPSREALATLGAWAMSIGDPSQDAIDETVSSLKL